jgi:hypothetical protein
MKDVQCVTWQLLFKQNIHMEDPIKRIVDTIPLSHQSTLPSAAAQVNYADADAIIEAVKSIVVDGASKKTILDGINDIKQDDEYGARTHAIFFTLKKNGVIDKYLESATKAILDSGVDSAIKTRRNQELIKIITTLKDTLTAIREYTLEQAKPYAIKLYLDDNGITEERIATELGKLTNPIAIIAGGNLDVVKRTLLTMIEKSLSFSETLRKQYNISPVEYARANDIKSAISSKLTKFFMGRPNHTHPYPLAPFVETKDATGLTALLILTGLAKSSQPLPSIGGIMDEEMIPLGIDTDAFIHGAVDSNVLPLGIGMDEQMIIDHPSVVPHVNRTQDMDEEPPSIINTTSQESFVPPPVKLVQGTTSGTVIPLGLDLGDDW